MAGSVALITAWTFGAHSVSAQSAASAQPVQPLPSYCETSTLTSDEFIQAINNIIKHGDLTDTTFIEKTLSAKFVVTAGVNENGAPNLQNLNYRTNSVLGEPIQVSLEIWSAAFRKKGMVDRIGFTSDPFPGSPANFIKDCLHISSAELYAFYGGKPKFSQFLATTAGAPSPNIQSRQSDSGNEPDFTAQYVMGAQTVLGGLGLNGSRLFLEFQFRSDLSHTEVSDTFKDYSVGSVEVFQQP